MRRSEVDEWIWQVGEDLHRLSQELTRTGPMLASRSCWQPRVDVREDASRVIVRAELAGMRGHDIQLVYISENHSLLIRGSRRDDVDQGAHPIGFHQLEIYHGEFEREVKLPQVAVDPDKIGAHYRNGFLTVTLPKLDADP